MEGLLSRTRCALESRALIFSRPCNLHYCRAIPISALANFKECYSNSRVRDAGDNAVNLEELKRNHLLAALPAEDWNRWSPFLEVVDLPLGRVIYESGGSLDYVYFPITAIVSLLYVMENGASAEIAVVGNEGIVGISIFMGGESTPSRAVVQSAGMGCRLEAQIMKSEFNRSGPVLHLLLRYTQALITQMAQTAVCMKKQSPSKIHVPTT